MLHVIPADDQVKHAATTECVCGPQLRWDGRRRRDVLEHFTAYPHPVTTRRGIR